MFRLVSVYLAHFALCVCLLAYVCVVVVVVCVFSQNYSVKLSVICWSTNLFIYLLWICHLRTLTWLRVICSITKLIRRIGQWLGQGMVIYQRSKELIVLTRSLFNSFIFIELTCLSSLCSDKAIFFFYFVRVYENVIRLNYILLLLQHMGITGLCTQLGQWRLMKTIKISYLCKEHQWKLTTQPKNILVLILV